MANKSKTKQKSATSGKTWAKKMMLEKIQKQMEEKEGSKMSKNEVIRRLCESYEQSIPLTPEEAEKLSEVSKTAKIPTAQLGHSIVTMGLKFYQSRYSNAAKDMKKTELRNSEKAGSAALKIDAFVKKVMKQNDEAKNIMDKVFISQVHISNHQGSNRHAIKAYLEFNKEMLDKHHEKHSLTVRHNCTAAKYRKALKQQKEAPKE